MSSHPQTETFQALWPGGARAIPTIATAPRPETLNGKRVAFVWDYVFRGDEIFPLLERQIRSQYPEAECVGYDAFGAIFGGDEHAVLAALPERLRANNIDAVVSGNGC